MDRSEYENKVTDELVYLREIARGEKNYVASDIIRDILDSRGSYVFDTADGQVIYHLGEGYTRDQVKNDLPYIDEKFHR